MTETNKIKVLEIEVQVKECETKDNPPRKFNAYKAVTKQGKIVDLKFRKEVTPLPTVDSMLEVLVENINKAKNTKYETYWIAKIEKITPLSEIKREITEGDLPF